MAFISRFSAVPNTLGLSPLNTRIFDCSGLNVDAQVSVQEEECTEARSPMKSQDSCQIMNIIVGHGFKRAGSCPSRRAKCKHDVVWVTSLQKLSFSKRWIHSSSCTDGPCFTSYSLSQHNNHEGDHSPDLSQQHHLNASSCGYRIVPPMQGTRYTSTQPMRMSGEQRRGPKTTSSLPWRRTAPSTTTCRPTVNTLEDIYAKATGYSNSLYVPSRDCFTESPDWDLILQEEDLVEEQ